MSPVSRGRNGKRKTNSTRGPVLAPDLIMEAEACDCAACAGEDLDPQALVDDLAAGAADLADSDDPLDAELLGALLVAIGEAAGEGFEDEVLAAGLVPMFEERASTEAATMLLAIGAVTPDPAGAAARAAAGRLAAAGVTLPSWAGELDQPVTAGECVRLHDQAGVASILVGSFHRAGRAHALVITVDHLECGAASEVFLVPGEHLTELFGQLREGMRASGLEVAEERLDPAELRWHAEQALDARAVHDGEPSESDLAESLSDEEDGPGYPVLAALARARLRTLPESASPKPQHGPHDLSFADVVESLGGARRRSFTPALPAQRAPADPPAPVYQLKVGLRGTKPPIWRRLEVPADISLGLLHEVIQAAFDWDDSHLHAFETPYGSYGQADDPELGQAAASGVTLEQVAPGEASKLRYTYDFGDSWEHEIVVEKVLDRDPAVAYPRCTGGRRAAPPEDCGGVWGYAALVDILADPGHPEHKDRLDWLGLDDPAEFDPAAFGAAEVTRALSAIRIG